jgi:carboxyl-terminal processing protease
MNQRLRVVLISALCTACAAIVGPDPAATKVALFDAVWRSVDLHYSFFLVKQVNWDSLRTVYRPRAQAAQDDNALAPVLVDLLGNLHDGHVVLNIGGNAYTTSSSSYPNRFDPTAAFEKYVESVGGFPSGLSYGLVNPAVGYMRLQTFDGTDWSSEVDSALQQLGGISSLIVDVRHNGGGLIDNATAIAGRFADRSTTGAYVRYRNGPAHSDFTSPIAQKVAPAGSSRFSGHVYVLTDRNTLSAAELFVLLMRSLGRTTVVGDTTGGQAGSPLVQELQNGWTYEFPESIEYTLDGHAFEDVGLPPDVPIQNTTVEINRLVDSQLERAISLAMTNH